MAAMMFLILNTSSKNKLPKKTTSKKFKAMYGYAADRLKRVKVKIQEIAATKAKEKQSSYGPFSSCKYFPQEK